MIYSKDCIAKYGIPANQANMILWIVPKNLQQGSIPKRIYCNKDLIDPLTKAFENIINHALIDELKTWDGCFNIRTIRGGVGFSLHSWGVAIDINAIWNQLGKAPTLTPGFVKCFTDAGFDWGGDWQRMDGMHFQLSEI